MNVGEAIAKILKAEGIKYLSVYPRQSLIDPCTEAGIPPIICRQERVGISIADGISRTTNGKTIGVFSCQAGAGVENAFPGIAQAFGDNVPLLFLPAGVHLRREYTHPNFSAVDNFRHITKWAAQVNQPGRVSELMRRAFHQLRSGPGGPVLIEVPADVVDAEIGGELTYTPVRPTRAAPDPADVKAAVETILAAERPVIHAGQGVLYAEASAELVKFAELIHAPVLTTNTGKSAFPENHPLALGASAANAPKMVNHFLAKADLVIGIGTSFTRTSWGPKVPVGKKIVHATNNPNDFGKEFATDVTLLGDAKLILDALVAEVGNRKRRGADGVVQEVAGIKKEWLEEWAPQLTSNEVPINQYRVLHDMMGAVERENTIVTHESGGPREQTVPFWECITPRSYLGWGKTTQLGHGLGLIMGAKLARPDKLCINIMGDAAIGMVGMDFETAVRNRIGILTIVFNNGVMAGERASMPAAIERHNALALGGNYAGVMKDLGGWSKRVEAPDQFLPAFHEAMEVTRSNEPAMIECIVKENRKFSRY
jgi:acetolactate synthase I/II/III large subunit